MKRLIILIFLTGCIYPCFAQSFISEDKLWCLLFEDSFEGKWKKTESFKFSGDTLINGLKFSKLYKSEDENKKNWQFHSYWRESNDSIFTDPDDKGHSNLIYNFNATEGDIFTLNKIDTAAYLVVDSVRTLLWGNKLRKHFYLHCPCDESWGTTIWVEGIGQLCNFTQITQMHMTGAFHSLLCFSENNQQVYQNPDYTSCYMNTVGVLQLPELQRLIEVYPTANGSVSLKSQSNGNLSFYSLDGRLVHKEQITQPETQICLPESGVLLYRFTTAKGEVQTGKVVTWGS